jgi:hypothetical protein
MRLTMAMCVARRRAVLMRRLLPSLDVVGRLSEDFHPDQRVREHRTVDDAADRARRQRRIGQARQHLQDVPQALDVLLRDRQDPEAHALGMIVAPAREAAEDAGRHEQRARENRVRELRRR